MRKKLFAVILAMLMIAAMSVAVLAENDGEIENATGDAVQKATVTVNLKLKNNLGIAGAIFEVEYDKEVLTPAETDFVKDGDIANLSVVANNKEDGKITLVVLSSEGQTVEGDGTVAKIVFKVSETAPVGQTTDITIKCKESAKANSETGSIDDTTIAEGMATLTFTDVTPGDVYDDNGDGKVNMKDAIAVARYFNSFPGYSQDDINYAAADVWDDGDGKVNMKDAIAIARHFNNFPGYETLPYGANN